MDRDIVRPLGRPGEGTRKRRIRNTGVSFWEHAVKINGSWNGNDYICRVKNKLGDKCFFCDKKKEGGKNTPINLSYIGFLTVADFSAWTNSKGVTYQYGRKLFGAKLGSKDYPGILKKLKRMKERHGRLTGCIFDIYRSGPKKPSIGDEFSLVEKIDPREIHEYAKRELGIDPVEKKWEPFNYSEEFKPVSNEQMAQDWGGSGQSQQQQQGDGDRTVGGGNGGAGWGNTGGDEDGYVPGAGGGDDDVQY